jgi:hypothetical protein
MSWKESVPKTEVWLGGWFWKGLQGNRFSSGSE